MTVRKRSNRIGLDRPGDGTRLTVLAGLATELIYLAAVLGPFSLFAHGTVLTDLGQITAFRASAAALVTAGLLALLMLYGLASGLISRVQVRALPIALGGTVGFCLTLVFLYPIIAMDIYTYAVQGYAIVFHQLNPLVSSPASVAANDPLIQFAGSWADSRSPYGPLWLDLSALAARAGNGDIVRTVLILKLLNALAVIGTSALLADLARPRGRLAAARAALLYGWNPLVLIEMVGNGHNDAVMIFLLVGFLALWRRRRPRLAVLFLVGSILTKYLTLGALPLYFLTELVAGWRGDGRCLTSSPEAAPPPRPNAHKERVRDARSFVSLALRLAIPATIALIAAAILYAPYWRGPESLARVLEVDDNYLASISALTVLVIPGSVDWLIYPRGLLLGLVALWQVIGILRGRTNLTRATFELIFAMIVIAPHFAGWYLGVLIALGVAADDWWLLARAQVFAIGAMLTIPLWAYLWPWKGDALGLATFHAILIPITFGGPLLLSVASIIPYSRNRRERKSTVEVPRTRPLV